MYEKCYEYIEQEKENCQDRSKNSIVSVYSKQQAKYYYLHFTGLHA